MRKYVLSAIFFSLILVLVGCSKDKEEKVDIIQGDLETEDKSIEKSSGKRLVSESVSEDGLSYGGYDSVGNGYLAVSMSDSSGKKLLGLMNSDFRWVVEPNDEILEYGIFSDGLISAGIIDPRGIRESKGLWGFLNEDGDWVVEPKFAEVAKFSEGLAYVQTIEEDRDDLGSSRGIVIDKTGKEMFEVLGSTTELNTIFPHETNYNKEFLKGTMEYYYYNSSESELTNFIIDSKGEKFESPDVESIAGKDSSLSFLKGDVPYTLSGYYVLFSVSEPAKDEGFYYKYDIRTKEVVDKKEFILSDDMNQNYVNIYGLSHSEFFISNELFLETDINDFSKFTVLNYNFEDLGEFETKNDSFNGVTGLSVKDSFISEEYRYLEDSKNNYLGHLSIENGKISYEDIVLKENDKLLYVRDYYLTEGNEYLIVKDLNDKVIVGEELKLLSVSSSVFLNSSVDPGNIVSVKYRDKENLTDIKKGLLNLDTLDILSLSDFKIN